MAEARRTLVVAGGGTGGHIWAGVAIADEWKRRNPGARVVFVGARGGLEEKLVPSAGLALELLNLGALKGKGLGTRLKTLLQLPLAFVKAGMVLAREKPSAVIGVGGYSAGPVVVMAWLLGFRTAILEQNAQPGFTNRIASRFAHTVFMALPPTQNTFRRPVRVTGNPVRSQLKPIPSAPRLPFTVFVFGGSQGALGVNTLVIDALPQVKDVRWVHQTGEKDYARVAEAHQKAETGARVEKFIFDMASCYAQADLVICRAGASTLAELAAVGRASVLVPLPTAADNHQEKNALIFVQGGASILLKQTDSSGADLARKIDELRKNPSILAEMETKARTFYRPDAAGEIVGHLL